MKTIILVEDDIAIQDAARLILERAGHKVVLFLDGYQIMSGNYEVPDIFILDKQLTGIDGIELCRFLKTQAATSGVPVIMLSANPHISTLARAAGADDSLEKPFAMRALREMVTEHMK